MAKIRKTASIENGLMEVLKILNEEEVQAAIGKGTSYIRKCSNPDLPQQIDHNDSFLLDKACIEKGKAPPLLTSHEFMIAKEFDKVFNVNAKSVYLSAKYFVPKMKKLKRGVILNVASTAGLSPRPKLNWYNASKGWMITATKAMAVELAPYNVRVNAIAPVAGKTPLLKSFMGGSSNKIKQAFLSTIPIGRFSTPQDMGNAACFLCSDEASMITGTVLEVDGGRCI